MVRFKWTKSDSTKLQVICSKKCDMNKCDPLGVTFFGVALFRMKWVVKGVGVRWVEGVDVHV